MRKAAEAAGLSRGQMYRALAVASIPEDDFEAAVESDAPPTVTQLVKDARERRGPRAPRTQGQRLRRCPHRGGDLTKRSDGDRMKLRDEPGYRAKRDGGRTLAPRLACLDPARVLRGQYRVTGGRVPHIVRADGDRWVCDCADAAFRPGGRCKHVVAVYLARQLAAPVRAVVGAS